MDWTSSDVLQVLIFLLPGFVTAWVYFSLTPHPKPSQFERVVQALIFTTFIQVLVFVLERALKCMGQYTFKLGMWTQNVALTVSILVAVLLGIVIVRFANNDRVHKLLRKCGITYQNSYSSEWFSAFARRQTYVTLHLKGERRLFGWPEEWPTEPDKGHFSMVEAEWLVGATRSIPLSNVDSILVPVSEVEMVEFLNYDSGSNEQSE